MNISGMTSKTLTLTCICALGFILSSCTELERPEPNPYLAESQPPSVKELRWSNGPAPKSLDPALASTAPETDIVRAIYEGLTVTDPKTLDAGPGVSESWTVSDDGLVWTFKLRDEAKWSNGKAVTAADFVRSWKRLDQMGDRIAHRKLLENFARVEGPHNPGNTNIPVDLDSTTEPAPDEKSLTNENGQSVVTNSQDHLERAEAGRDVPIAEKPAPELDVAAPDGETLVVKLVRPDREFPRVVAHPIFCPVFDGKTKDRKTIANGPLKIAAGEDASIVLERSENYWNSDAVSLDKIIFVPATKPDDALAAYRDGKVDVVTNTEFAPLAQKLFSPYADFKKSAFAALNYYEVNYRKAPFNDRRVREALAIAIEREKISDVELEGTTLPAFSFLPFPDESKAKIVQDKDRAAELLEQAGFPDGSGFPMIRLVVNRNEVQQRVARAVARMWKANLNIDTEIVLAENTEFDEIRKTNNFDLLRRGAVFPTASEFVSISTIFENEATMSPSIATESPSPAPSLGQARNSTVETGSSPATLSEAQAIFELHAIPLYFPMSFSLVKPYVNGFESNNLDSVSVNEISIDAEWRPKIKQAN